MYKGINKLAKLIKLMAKDVSYESSWWKHENIGPVIGLYETDTFFDEISVTDDSGYRCITVGDTRGNVSRVNGRPIKKEEHKGYMLLYSENSSYKNGKRVWKYKCFPSQEEIANRLQTVLDGNSLIPLDKNNCDTEEFWYSERDDETLKYLSGIVRKFADIIAADPRTAEKIFSDCNSEDV